MANTEIIPGEKVVLDKKYRNTSIVEVVRLGKYFATVKDEDSEWDVMKCRLTKIEENES
jgi:hypothetical protein